MAQSKAKVKPYRYSKVKGKTRRISEKEYRRRLKISASLKSYYASKRGTSKPVKASRPDLSTAVSVRPGSGQLLVTLTSQQYEAIKVDRAKQAAKRRRKQLETLKQSIRKKVKPGDYGKVRFFDVEGKRIGDLRKAGNKKLWVVKFDRRGRMKILNSDDRATVAPGVAPVKSPSRLRLLDLWKAAKETPKDYKEVLEELRKRLKRSPVASPLVGRTFRHVSKAGDIDGAVKKMYSQFGKLKTATRGHSVWVIQGYITTMDKQPPLIGFTTAPLKTAHFYRYDRAKNEWIMTRKNGADLIRDMILAMIYAPVARGLERYGKISKGSKRRMRPVEDLEDMLDSGEIDEDEYNEMLERHAELEEVQIKEIFWRWEPIF